ncbi:MAG: hypothetical protein K2Q10_12240 [Rhodospirillales bacterium]|nr:hypothetical protein [Rhodospirillales bacterium]
MIKIVTAIGYATFWMLVAALTGNGIGLLMVKPLGSRETASRWAGTFNRHTSCLRP